jgi:tRNA modification GTPase
MSPLPRTLVAAHLTPGGSAAIAVIGVRGAGVVELLRQRFTPLAGDGWSRAVRGDLLLGSWRRADGSSEELLLVGRDDEVWEIHCHGGVAAVETLLTDLQACGVELIPWRAWLEQELEDPLRAEAWIALADAATARTAAILLDQYRGALRAALEEIRGRVVRGDATVALAGVGQLLQRWAIGRHLTAPWRVTLLGPPNVGKSSLLNQILGYARAIVYDQPGTTRDIVSAQTALDGWPIELADTAGLRDSVDHLEREGIVRARDHAERADLILYLADASVNVFEADVAAVIPEVALLSARAFPPVLRVLNKWDLRAGSEPPASGWLPVSARTGEGVEELMGEIVRCLVPREPLPGMALPFQPRHERHLRACEEALRTSDVAGAARELECLLASREPTFS